MKNLGWQCPKCGKVYSPIWIECTTCNNHVTKTEKTQLSPVQIMYENYNHPAVKCKSCGIDYDFQGGVDGLGCMKRCKCDVQA